MTPPTAPFAADRPAPDSQLPSRKRRTFGVLAAWLVLTLAVAAAATLTAPAAVLRRDGAVVLCLLLNVLLLAAPGVALLPWFRRRVLPEAGDAAAPLLAIGLSSVAGYLLFWIYWLHPLAGNLATALCALGSAAALWRQRPELPRALGGRDAAWVA
ncbi:MAG: hypothetical protein JO295_08945, partial [Verrucomicrobia bacterium]|nr:hypothetical protein [Verrucomicrobiota bacterium]